MRTRGQKKGPLPSSERLLRTIIDSEPQCVKLLAADGTLLDMNPAGLAMIEADSLEEVRGRCIYALVAEEHRLAFQDLTEAAFRGQAGTLQFRSVGLKGGVRWLETRAVPLRDPLMPSGAVLGITRDITEQRRAEDALKESLRFNAQIVASAREGIVVHDRQLRYVIWNPVMEELSGRPATEVVGRHPLEVFPFLREQGVYARLEKALHGETLASPDVEYKHPQTGRTSWAWAAHAPLRDAQGQIIGVITTVRDTTERKAAEEALRDSHRVLQAIIESTTDAVFVKDARSRYLLMNSAGAALLGTTAADVVGRDDADFFSPESVTRIRETDRQIMEEGQPLTVEEEATAAGVTRTYLSSKAPYRGPDGSVIGIIGIARDVTERERALSLLNATLESTADGLLVTDAQGRLLSFNQKFARMWRIPEDLLATGDDDAALAFVLDQLKDPEGFVKRVREIYASKDEESFDILEFKDGRIFERYSLPQRIGGRSVGRVASFRDVTERREIEERLRQSQKLEAIGRLAGGVAHDFNNILTALLGYSSRLLREVVPEDPLRPPIEGIQKAAERAASLTHQLLAFSRRQVLRPRVLSLSAVVAGMDDMLRRVIPESIELATALDSDVGHVKADPGQMEQVVLNLAVNARDAMPSGGRLTIETSDTDLREPLGREGLRIPAGRYAALSVRDTGLGMDAETRSHIFEPFFTTKDPGHGTGLGLATVYGIVKQSAGYVWAESQPGQGTTMRVFLPRVEEEVDVVADPPEGKDGRPATGTILLVEDEEGVRAIAKEVLETEGYRVLQARNGQEALALARAAAEPIHLLFTDVVMPGMNGHELAARLTEVWPGIQVLYTSGYDEETLRADASSAEEALLPKPYRPDALVRKVRDVMAAPR